MKVAVIQFDDLREILDRRFVSLELGEYVRTLEIRCRVVGERPDVTIERLKSGGEILLASERPVSKSPKTL